VDWIFFPALNPEQRTPFFTPKARLLILRRAGGPARRASSRPHRVPFVSEGLCEPTSLLPAPSPTRAAEEMRNRSRRSWAWTAALWISDVATRVRAAAAPRGAHIGLSRDS